MSEIEKMYELADVQPQYKKRIECKEGHPIGQPCEKCPCIDCDKSIFEDVMPPFTAEKQIELIKWLVSSHKGVLISDFGKGDFNISTGYYHCAKHIQKFRHNKDLRVAIAMFINDRWQDLTAEEKQQVKGILE